MTRKRKDKQAELMYDEYKKGFSLSEVGKMFGVTRQSVYVMFKCRSFELRKKKELPYQYFNGEKFTPQNNGYFRSTNHRKSRLMHRIIWEFNKGKIPKGYDIHHKDRDKSNNKIDNLEMIKKDEHARKYSTGKNQHTKK